MAQHDKAFDERMTTQFSNCYPFVSQEARDFYLSYYDQRARQRWPLLANAENRMVETSFGQTFLRVGGPKNGPPLVLIPGDSETSLSWSFIIEALSRDHRMYAMDHVNDIGRSIPNKSQPITKPDDFVKYLDELFSKLNLERINLVAHSYGGWQACLYALAHPERLQKLVLLAPSATVLPPRFGLLLRAILFKLIPLRWVTKRYLYWFAPASVTTAQTRTVIDEMVEEQILTWKCYEPKKFIRPTVLTDQEWQSFTVNTLFLVGDQEVMYRPYDVVQRLDKVT